VMEGADLFIGLSGARVVDASAVARMNPDPIVFAMANPVPEVSPEEAAPYARIMATGRSDYPNQINNVLAFPGIFRGALDVRATQITERMKTAAAQAIALIIADDELREDYIIPSVFNRDVAPAVAAAVASEARESGLAEAGAELGVCADGGVRGDWGAVGLPGALVGVPPATSLFFNCTGEGEGSVLRALTSRWRRCDDRPLRGAGRLTCHPRIPTLRRHTSWRFGGASSHRRFWQHRRADNRDRESPARPDLARSDARRRNQAERHRSTRPLRPPHSNAKRRLRRGPCCPHSSRRRDRGAPCLRPPCRPQPPHRGAAAEAPTRGRRDRPPHDPRPARGQADRPPRSPEPPASTAPRSRSSIGLPVTSALRTLLDLAAVVGIATLERAIEQALHEKLVSVRQLRQAIAGNNGRKGIPNLRAILDQQREPGFTRSRAERRMRELIRLAQLPEPKTNVPMYGVEADLYWPEFEVVIEGPEPEVPPDPGRARTRHPQGCAPDREGQDRLLRHLAADGARAVCGRGASRSDARAGRGGDPVAEHADPPRSRARPRSPS